MATLEKSERVTPRGIGGKDYGRGVEVYAPQPELLFFEGFEDLPQVYNIGGSAGYGVARITQNAWRGGACLRMTSGNAPADNYCSWLKRFGLGSTRKLLLDLAFSFAIAQAGTDVTFRLGRQKGNGLAYGGVTYDVVNELWYLGRKDLGTDVPITGGSQKLFKQLYAFHRVFLAVDFDSEEFLYLRCNDLTMDLSGIAITNEASIIDPYAFVYIYFTTGVLPAQELFIDNVKVSELA